MKAVAFALSILLLFAIIGIGVFVADILHQSGFDALADEVKKLAPVFGASMASFCFGFFGGFRAAADLSKTPTEGGGQ